MVSLCQCYCKIQVLVPQTLSAPAPPSQHSFDLMPVDVSALLSLPLGDFSGASPARPVPFSGVPRPKVPGTLERSPQGRLGLPEGCTPQTPGSFRRSHWTLRSARGPCAGARVLCSGGGSGAGQQCLFSAHSRPRTCVSHCHPERWVQPPLS